MIGLQSVGRSVLDLMYPPCCRMCDRCIHHENPALCENCHTRITAEVAAPTCPICASTVASFEKTEDGCGDCRGQNLLITATARVATYRCGVGFMLRGFKYRRREEAEPLLCEWLVQAVLRAPWRWQFEGVVPVPTVWHRRLWRATYPPDVLGNAVAKALRVPYRNALRRIRGGPRQVDVSEAERRANVLGAFIVDDESSVKGRSLLLIDDIRTTGATLEECAKVLMKSGVAKIFAAVVCRAEGQSADGI